MSALQIINCEQGTPEWHAARAGIVTTSEFDSVLASGRGGAPSKTRATYMFKLAGERITGKVGQTWAGNADTERGHEMEPEARDRYAFIEGVTPVQVGFMRRGNVGCSPDSLVGDRGLLEIKTKAPHILIPLLLDSEAEMPSEHMPQVQGQLWVSGREWVDFVAYYRGLPMLIKRVFRDEPYIARLAAAVSVFEEELQAVVYRIQSMKEAA